MNTNFHKNKKTKSQFMVRKKTTNTDTNRTKMSACLFLLKMKYTKSSPEFLPFITS